MIRPNEGECLVIRRTLSGIVIQESRVKEKPSSDTKCSGYKLWSLLNDEGSCLNVVSQSMAEKLNLVTSPHIEPYLIQWLNQGKCINVTS